MVAHDLTNFEKQKYDQNEPKFNSFHSRINLPRSKDGVYVRNLDQCESTNCMAFYVNGNNGRASYNEIYFDSFVG